MSGAFIETFFPVDRCAAYACNKWIGTQKLLCYLYNEQRWLTRVKKKTMSILYNQFWSTISTWNHYSRYIKMIGERKKYIVYKWLGKNNRKEKKENRKSEFQQVILENSNWMKIAIEEYSNKLNELKVEDAYLYFKWHLSCTTCALRWKLFLYKYWIY